MAKQVLDLRGSAGISSGLSTEHLRNYKVTDPDMKKYGYYDPTREHLNFEVGRGGVIMPVNKNYSLNKRFADNLRRRGIEDPNKKKRQKGKAANRRTLANIILGGSQEQMRLLAFGDQEVSYLKESDNRGLQRKEDIEKWAIDMYNFIAGKFGEDNIVAFVVHLDEKNPHVHCSLIPEIDGKISYRKMFVGENNDKAAGREFFKKFHDEMAVVNKKWKLDRGEDIRLTGAKHVTSEEYWQNLRNECTRLENETGNKRAVIDKLDKEIRRAQIAQKSLTTMINNIEAHKAALENEIAELDLKNDEADANNIALQQQKEDLLNKIKELDDKLFGKRKALGEFNEKLNRLADSRAALEHERDDLVREVNQLKKEQIDVETTNMADKGYDIVADQLKRFLQIWQEASIHLPDDLREKLEMDDSFSFLENIAHRSDDIVAVSTGLYLGYVEEVLKYANAHGGGGGSVGNWGRDKDEDDEAFRHRCFLMGSMLMRPSNQKEIKKSRWKR